VVLFVPLECQAVVLQPAVAAGADNALSKPFRLADLISIVEQLAGAR